MSIVLGGCCEGECGDTDDPCLECVEDTEINICIEWYGRVASPWSVKGSRYQQMTQFTTNWGQQYVNWEPVPGTGRPAYVDNSSLMFEGTENYILHSYIHTPRYCDKGGDPWATCWNGRGTWVVNNSKPIQWAFSPWSGADENGIHFGNTTSEALYPWTVPEGLPGNKDPLKGWLSMDPDMLLIKVTEGPCADNSAHKEQLWRGEHTSVQGNLRKALPKFTKEFEIKEGFSLF